jgi:N-acetylglucosamine-6-phosphate deacetylase
MLYLHHARLLTDPQDIQDGAVLIDGQRIAAVGASTDLLCPPGAQALDASGLTLTPGFIDLQFNGAFGLDFTADPTTLWDVAARLPPHGVTSFLPTIITSPLETIATAQAVLRNPPADFHGATPLGLHIEGPFLNPSKRGAHNPAHLRPPNPAAVSAWSPGSGVRLVTLAPELPRAIEVIESLRARGVVVSAGHSMATYAEALAGLAAGVTYGTHLFNAMPALDHRAPGLAAALLVDPRAIVGLIPDGVHLHPAIVKLIWRAKGPAGVSVVTDAMAALGMPPGVYQLGDFNVTVDGTAARLGDGRLAGSILSLDQAVRNLIAFTGCSLGEALASVTTLPARVLGLTDRGQIAPGCVADLVLLTPDLNVVMTIVRGEVCYTARA